MRPVHAMMLRWLAPLALTIPAAGQAAPLTLHELDQMPVAIACRDMCAAEAAVDRAACLSGCQYPVQASWEKNNAEPVNALDFMLAVLEFWDGGDSTSICYESGAVVPKAACGQGDCLATHAAAECADADGDGLLAWEESLIGTSDGVAQRLCTANAACGFSSQCEFNFEIGKSVCLPRSCGGTAGQACTPTAFHLEPIASNNKEVILHLHFDYSPVPATVLDLRVLYSDVDLVLVDARPLALLTAAGKGVNVTHPAAGVVRLVVLGMGTMAPVPNGAIVELVFQRATKSQTTIGFDTTDIYQRNSMAPSQGASQAELAKNELWGSTVAIAGATDGPRLVLAYSFDSLAKPLEYSDVPSAADLCDWMDLEDCPRSGLAGTNALASLSMLQSGSMAAKTLIPGVNGSAAYFDGTWDHLDLPVALNDPLTDKSQSSSMSMWLLPEGRSSDELRSGYYQVLWSHQRFDETARYGIRVAENAQSAETVDLVWFDDGSAAQPTTPFAVGLPLHKWVHLGMTLDALSGKVQLFVDGALAKTVALAKSPALSCPQLGLEQAKTPPVVLHKQGDGSGEAIYLARPENGLFGIDRMDPSGFGLASVIRSSDASFQDPDYSPLVDKVVYSSNKSGNTEIWMANGNGSNAVQLTTGFGNARDGVFARRPRWAPDASAIIFESNAFDATTTTKSSAVYHLYRLKYDTKPDAALPNLDFGMIVRKQEVDSYRITTGADHHTNVAWLRGPTATSLGEIAYNVADPLYRQFQAKSLVLPAEISAIRNTEGELPVPAAAGVVDSSVRLLAANGRSSEGKDVSRLLYLASQTSFLPSTRFSLSTLTADSAVGGETRIQVLHTPPSGCTGACLPTEIPSLYLAYDEGVGSPDVTMTSTGSRAGSGLPADKSLELRDIGYTSAEGKSLRFVRISVGASASATVPAGAEVAVIPANAEVAVIRFVRRRADQSLGLALQDRVDTRRLYLKDRARDGAALPLIVRADLIEEVEEAAFSPNGARLILTGVSRSRPTLLRGDIVEPEMDGAAYSLTGEQVLETTSTRTEGISWTKVDGFMPCNRVAATRNPYLQLYQHGFRGALDELKVYSYVRDAGAFRSDADRGHDWLRAAGRNGVLEAIRPTCTGLDTECPPYMVCNASTNRCERSFCKPEVPDSCAGHGLCSYRPLPVEAENPDPDSNSNWLCSSDCNTDSQCFQRDCLNGPCRFCTNGSCNECNIVEKDYGSLKVRETVGCPDSNSWACENGNCISQCYSFENGVSKYLCNPTEEYCLRGHCEPMQWNWSELGPSSLLGLGEMRLNTAPLQYTIAIPQMVPITVKAYGVEDYGHSPEILVEGRVSGSDQAFLAQWFTIGRILVDHRRHVEAQADDGAYSLLTPYPITDLRLRLVTPSLQNFANASTGFGFPGEDKDLASGSKFALGYELGIPTWKVYAACDARGTTACAGKLTTDPYRQYLRGGQPAAVILDVKVNGVAVLVPPQSDQKPSAPVVENRICSYEGTAETSALGLPPKKVFYGSIATEKSNEKTLYCKSAGANCASPNLSPTVHFDTSMGDALLNCNYFDPERPDDSAGLVMSFQPPTFGSVAVTENANICRIETDQRDAHGRPISVDCYEFEDGDASLDVMNPGQMVFGSQELLEFDIFRFFAWDSRGP